MTDRKHMARHSSDIDRLQRLAFANGVPATRKQIYAAWSAYSDSSAAGWLILYDEHEYNWASISGRLEDVDAANSSANDDFDAFQDDLDRIIDIARRNGHDLDKAEAFAAWDRASRNQMQDWASLAGYDSDIWAELQPVLQTEA